MTFDTACRTCWQGIPLDSGSVDAITVCGRDLTAVTRSCVIEVLLPAAMAALFRSAPEALVGNRCREGPLAEPNHVIPSENLDKGSQIASVSGIS